MWRIFIVPYEEDGEDAEQCLWKSQSREKVLPLQFWAAGKSRKKEVLAAGGWGEPMPSILRAAQGTNWAAREDGVEKQLL